MVNDPVALFVWYFKQIGSPVLGVGYTSAEYGNAYRFNGGPGGIVPHADRENARSRVVRVVDPAEQNQAGRNAKGSLNDDLNRRRQAADDQSRPQRHRRSPRLDVSLPSASTLKFGASLAFQAQQIAQGDAIVPTPDTGSNTRSKPDTENNNADTPQRPRTQVAEFSASQAYQDTADMAAIKVLPPLPANVKLPTLA